MEKYIIRYTLRINNNLFEKFHYISEFSGRSANKEIEQLIKKRVEDFEREHGKIEINSQKENI